MSGYYQIARFMFSQWVFKDYSRSYGDWRDEDQEVAMPDGGYRGQVRENEVTFVSQKVDTNLPELKLVDPPPIGEIAPYAVSCKCGLVCPTEMQNRHKPAHFRTT